MNPLVYKSRPCKFLGVRQYEEIFYKIYFVWSEKFSETDAPDLDVMERLINERLSSWYSRNDHPVAFVIVHFADDGAYLLVSKWNDANMIRHQVCSLKFDLSQAEVSPLSDTSIIACVWELKLIMHERDFWIESVLNHSSSVLSEHMIHDYLNQNYEGNL